MKAIPTTLLGAAMLLAGCGSAAGGSGGKDWAVDACETFPGVAAGKAAGMTIAGTQNSPGASAGDTHVSTCTYTAANGALFTVALRHDTSGSGTMADAIEGLTAKPDLTGPVEELVVTKGRAFWSPRLKTLTYLPDNDRMVSVTPPGMKLGESTADVSLKQQALTIAEAAARQP